MKRHGVKAFRQCVLFAVLSGIASLSAAQTPATTYRDLQSTLDAAQAAANRPGDESLSCEALAGELVASANNPAVRSFVAKSGADAQEKMAAMNAAPAGMAAQSAVTLFSSIVPGGAWAGHAAAVGQAQSQQAQAASNMQQMMQQAQEMMTIMPQIMRGQRVIELAQARKCEWLREGGLRP